MYVGDSLFTLGAGGQAGLLLLSAGLSIALALGARRLMRGRGLPVRIGLAAALFAGFVWLSPQVYYAYYRMIFDGLPVQWVIGWPPLRDAVAYASFTGPRNLSAHGQGLLFWLLMALAFRGSGRPGPPQ